MKLDFMAAALLLVSLELGCNNNGSSLEGILVADESSKIREISIEETKHPVEVAFNIKNTGNKKVNIVHIATSCNCTETKIANKSIEPGATGTLIASVTPLPAGEQTTTIQVETDSKETPTLDLSLKLVSIRKAPFILKMGGDLNFNGNIKTGDSRPLSITAIVDKPEGREAPQPKNSQPFLSLEPTKQERFDYIKLPNGSMTYRIEYLFNLRIKETPPAGTFSDVVTLADPWDQSQIFTQNVYGKSNGPVQFIPSVLVFRSSPNGRPEREKTILIRINRSEKNLSNGMLNTTVDPPGCVTTSTSTSTNDDTDLETLDCIIKLEKGINKVDKTFHFTIKLLDAEGLQIGSLNGLIMPGNY